jgi:hypothetical protein
MATWPLGAFLNLASSYRAVLWLQCFLCSQPPKKDLPAWITQEGDPKRQPLAQRGRKLELSLYPLSFRRLLLLSKFLRYHALILFHASSLVFSQTTTVHPRFSCHGPNTIVDLNLRNLTLIPPTIRRSCRSSGCRQRAITATPVTKWITSKSCLEAHSNTQP